MPGVAGAVIGICGALAGVSGCISQASSGGDGQPIVLCGTTFQSNGSDVNFYSDIARNSGRTVTYSNDGEKIILAVSSGCDKGSQVTWTPSSAAHLAQSAYAKDGLLAAFSLQPNSPDAVFTVTATQAGRLVGTVTCKPAF
jgi:hypothetical protein